MNITYQYNTIPKKDEIINLYHSVNWGHSKCPNATYEAIKNSSSVVSAWSGERLVGLGRAITDKTITVYFPDLLIDPNWQGKGIGTEIMKMLLKKYSLFHNQILIAEDEKARKFYMKFGFRNENYAMSITKPFPKET